ncbi:hypothetical protein CYY_006402 [Polysphondylium violaceum]|uniref:Major facilitator superfamily (MFS) profile domain-containing protein n=1 Tax=Polysphondylium violaceum TaxID=133409 RepID=A0A8J4PQH4_9MYCE|nr:hypothetical protein CYY_006402 [Polysphondylium violaceum]
MGKNDNGNTPILECESEPEDEGPHHPQNQRSGSVSMIILNSPTLHEVVDNPKSSLISTTNDDTDYSEISDDSTESDNQSVKEEDLESIHIEKDDLLSNDADAKPPPISKSQWARIIMIYMAVFSDALALTLVTPFLSEILIEKWNIQEDNVGYYSGILVGIYSLARFISGFNLGHLSDKYGRKPFLILSLLATGIGTIIFPLVPNVYLAIIIRFVEGILSNTMALCQATLADMVDKKNRPVVFAYMGSVFALSRCLSSAIGGFSVKIAQDAKNPYLLPCIIGGSIVLLSGLLILVFHPETHPKLAKKSITEETVEPTLNVEQKEYSFFEGLKLITKNRTVLHLMVMGSLNSFANGGLLLGIVLFASLSIEEKGMGFDSFKIGILFTVFGLVGFAFQLLFFKRLSKSLGLKKQYLMGMILLGASMLLYPVIYTGYLIQGEAMVWVISIFVVIIMGIGWMQAMSILQGMVANASDPKIQGLTQGSYQSLNSLLRAFGPVVSGAIFSLSTNWSAPFILFIVLAVIYLTVGKISHHLPESVDVLKKKEVTQEKV